MSTRRNFIDPRDVPAALADLNALPVTLTDAATIAIDPKLGDYFVVTLGGNRTLGVAATPYREGGTYHFEIRQDATGSRLLTWPAAFDWGTVGAPTLTTTANKSDVYRGVFRNGVMRMVIGSKGHN